MSTVASQVLEAPATQRTLWRGAMYEALALALSYPDEEVVADLTAGLDALLAHEVTRGSEVRPALETLATALVAVDRQRLAELYNLCFAGEVPCSPCETDYEVDGFAKARRLADIAGFYRAYGLQVPAANPAPADSIATELEFMSDTVMRQAYAAVHGWDDKQQICEETQRAFLEDHLGRWAPLFCRALFDLVGGEGPYAAAAALCEQFVAEEIALYGVTPRPASPRRANASDAGAFTCMFAAPSEEDKEDEP